MSRTKEEKAILILIPTSRMKNHKETEKQHERSLKLKPRAMTAQAREGRSEFSRKRRKKRMSSL